MQVERELKLLILLDEYTSLEKYLTTYFSAKYIQQFNHYFDLFHIMDGQKKWSLRVRRERKNGSEEVILTAKSSLIEEGEYQGRIELESKHEDVPQDKYTCLFRRLLVQHDVIEKTRLNEYYIREVGKTENLRLSVHDKNLMSRHSKQHHHIPRSLFKELALDKTTYPDGFEDYEIEIEFWDKDDIYEIGDFIRNILCHLSIPYRQQDMSKRARLAQHLLGI
jgi:uncharacterized protein YjbK